MYILPTTTAVLIAFLAVIAYSEVRNRLAKGVQWRQSRKKDLETPSSPARAVVRDTKSLLPDSSSGDALSPSVDGSADESLAKLKDLYHKLHNLEYYPEILPECRELLLTLFSSTITEATQDPNEGILSVNHFSRDGLDRFLADKDVDVTNRWEEYLARRSAGGPHEMFRDKEEAIWWLKQAAPVKYVDGAWLGHINKISTPFKYRHITKNAWQVMSEELGDGDLAKNHVHVYRELMNDIDADLPPADSKDFIHSRHGLTETRCWEAALAQLIVSLFPHDFLPEALGFNMAYESLPLHLLKTVKELRELRLNPYYFELHISIDNADSGHAAMAAAAVASYIDLVSAEEGEEAAHVAWRRVQAGYILAEGLPTTPESPSQKTKSEGPFPRTATEAELIGIFTAKSPVAHKIHCNSRLKIGRRSLVDWLEPVAFKDVRWQQEFLQDLGNCKPWVVKGISDKSRLIKELSWEGKMFGSFTEKEVNVVKAWIDELGSSASALGPNSDVYMQFTGQISDDTVEPHEKRDILTHYPVLGTPEPIIASLPQTLSDVMIGNAPRLDLKRLDLANFLPLWFTSLTLLEALPAVPVRAADTFGSAIVRVLRAQTGFSIEGPGVAGMDEVRRTDDGQAVGIVELGLEVCRNAGIGQPPNLGAVCALGNSESVAFSEWMIWVSMGWRIHRDLLVGMAWAFMEVHEAVAQAGEHVNLLAKKSRCVLQEIADRERKALEVCRDEIYQHEQREEAFLKGLSKGREAIGACFTK